MLSIDGGGTRGYLPALVLRELEYRAGCRASELFDVIVGTSTGGIIGIGLAVGRSAEELADFYPRYGRAIFGGIDGRPEWKRRLLGPTGNVVADFRNSGRILGSPFGGDKRRGGSARHSADGLNGALHEVLGESRLSGVSTPLIATTYDASADCPIVLSSRDASRASEYDLSLHEVARATSAAPTFFPALETTWAGARRRFIDGGVWANNPAHIGLLEALTRTGGDLSSIVVVSLGTGAAPGAPSFQSDLNWLGVAMDTMSVATTVQTGHLLCQRYLPPDRYFRLQVVDRDIAGAMNDASAERLTALAAAASRMIADQGSRLDSIVKQLQDRRPR
ncbi:patatin-like phospholipase family protein [Mycolicibacterium sp.]|uniref:patatin-like phospholipase family protein n=1 Tax=Mycolicibacterium sp. TaxID=2320850 RepID=UPI0028AF24A6|nr:patatin-like phospholipase family protein [Mycolicibacterium sp.]